MCAFLFSSFDYVFGARALGLSLLILAFGHNLWNEKRKMYTGSVRPKMWGKKGERGIDEQFRQCKGAKNITSPANFRSKFRFDVNPNMRAAAKLGKAPSVTNKFLLSGNVYRSNAEHTRCNRLWWHRHHIRARQSSQINLVWTSVFVLSLLLPIPTKFWWCCAIAIFAYCNRSNFPNSCVEREQQSTIKRAYRQKKKKTSK